MRNQTRPIRKASQYPRPLTPAPLIETKPAAEISVDHFSEIIFFPVRLAFADRPHSAEPFSFQDVSCALTCAPNSPWKEGSALVSEIGLPAGLSLQSEHWAKLQQAQAHAYFHPFIRQFLFDTVHYDNDYRIGFHRTDITNMVVQLGGQLASALDKDETSKPVYIDLKVKRCELEVVRLGVAILVLEVESTQTLLLNQVQQIQSQLRRTFSPYFDDYANGCCAVVQNPLSAKIPRTVELKGLDVDGKPIVLNSFFVGTATKDGAQKIHEDELKKRFTVEPNSPLKTNSPDSIPVASHWHFMLSPLIAEITPGCRQLRYIPLGDDRLPTMSYIAVTDPREITRGDWMRLCFADETGDGVLPYAQKFLTNFEANYCYDRFWYAEGETTDGPSRILNCGMTFCFVGNSSNSFFTNNKNGAIATFRTIYSRLGLIAHLQKAALLTASIRISELSERSAHHVKDPPDYNDKKELIDRFYREFIEFTHVYWFDEVTPQIQGIELFSAWQHHLRTKALHNEVRQELMDLTTAINSQSQVELSSQTFTLTKYAGIFALFSVAIALLSMDVFKVVSDPQLKTIAGLSAGVTTALYIVGVVVLVSASIKFFLWLFPKQK